MCIRRIICTLTLWGSQEYEKAYFKNYVGDCNSLSLIAVIYYVIYAIGEPAFFREADQLMLAICMMMFGLFLGLYRIIDLLEQKQK